MTQSFCNTPNCIVPCIVYYDRKWYTKFYEDCMFANFFILPLRRLMINFLIFKLVFGAMSGPELGQNSQFNCTVY